MLSENIGFYLGDSITFIETVDFNLLPLEFSHTLEEDLYQVASKGFNRPLTDDFRADVASHIRGGFLQVALENQKAVAFAVSQFHEDTKTAYIAGIVKNPNAPRSIVEKMLGNFIEQYNPSILITRTQNDRVMDIICHFCPIVVPIDRSVTADELKLLSDFNLLSSNTNQELLITRGHYGGQMIFDSIRRRSLDEKVVNFSNQLNYQEGDAALLIGYR